MSDNITVMKHELHQERLKNDRLTTEVADLKAQLPESMQDCTIQFKSCPLGHGWLTATNWIQHDCKQCEFDRLTAEVTYLDSRLKRIFESDDIVETGYLADEAMQRNAVSGSPTPQSACPCGDATHCGTDQA